MGRRRQLQDGVRRGRPEDRPCRPVCRSVYLSRQGRFWQAAEKAQLRSGSTQHPIHAPLQTSNLRCTALEVSRCTGMPNITEQLVLCMDGGNLASWGAQFPCFPGVAFLPWFLLVFFFPGQVYCCTESF